jgi:hypothetical protein
VFQLFWFCVAWICHVFVSLKCMLQSNSSQIISIEFQSNSIPNWWKTTKLITQMMMMMMRLIGWMDKMIRMMLWLIRYRWMTSWSQNLGLGFWCKNYKSVQPKFMVFRKLNVGYSCAQMGCNCPFSDTLWKCAISNPIFKLW